MAKHKKKQKEKLENLQNVNNGKTQRSFQLHRY